MKLIKVPKVNKYLIKNFIPVKTSGLLPITVIILLLAMLLTYFSLTGLKSLDHSQDMTYAGNPYETTTLLQLLTEYGGEILPKILPQILQCDTKPNLEKSQKTNKSCNATIIDFVRRGESLYDIFKKKNIDMEQFSKISKTIKGIFNLKDIKPNMSYRIVLDRSTDDLVQLRYAINGSTFLEVNNKNGRYKAKTIEIPLEKKYGVIYGKINNSLLGSTNNKMDYTVLYELSDIFAWDIDFTTDIKKGDTYKIIVEQYYSNGIFRHYGRILYAELKNDGVRHEAFWYSKGKIHGYFNSEGKSFQTALTRAPLRFRYISSYFTYNRLHPILKIRRPHLGVDYAAPAGTPVSAAGEGIIQTASYNSQIGNHVRISHPGGYKTNYGHLQGFAKGIFAGKRVHQGEIIGFVGQTGLATGPHLDYRVQLNNAPINPLTMKLPTLQSIPPRLVNDFMIASAKMKREMSTLYAGVNDFKGYKKTAQF